MYDSCNILYIGTSSTTPRSSHHQMRSVQSPRSSMPMDFLVGHHSVSSPQQQQQFVGSPPVHQQLQQQRFPYGQYPGAGGGSGSPYGRSSGGGFVSSPTRPSGFPVGYPPQSPQMMATMRQQQTRPQQPQMPMQQQRQGPMITTSPTVLPAALAQQRRMPTPPSVSIRTPGATQVPTAIMADAKQDVELMSSDSSSSSSSDSPS